MSAVTTILDETLASITPVDTALLDHAARRLDSLTKPKGSLGGLEEFARRFRDMAGVVNKRMAEEADEVYLLTAGIPLKLK